MQPRPIVPWGVLIGGEELHNNHHAFPSSPRFAVQRWEIDIGWLFICVFRALGLARVGSLALRKFALRLPTYASAAGISGTGRPAHLGTK